MRRASPATAARRSSGCSQQFADGGGELLVCPICVNARKLDADTFVANARVAGATPMLGVARRRGGTVFSY